MSSGIVGSCRGQWYPASGDRTDVAGGKQGQAGGDAFQLSKATGSDLTLEGDVKLTSGTAAAITFRAHEDASRHYTANLDAEVGVVKLWRPGRDIATRPLVIEHVAPITSRSLQPAQLSRSGSTAP